MKVLYLLPFLLSSPVFAVPGQTILGGDLGDLDLAGLAGSDVFRDIAKGAKSIAHNALEKSKHKIEQWAEDGKEFVKQHDMVCKYTISARIRITTKLE